MLSLCKSLVLYLGTEGMMQGEENTKTWNLCLLFSGAAQGAGTISLDTILVQIKV